MTSTTGGEIVAHALAAQGIRHAFCVPGESYLPVLAALEGAGITAMTCRHEGTASMAAEAMGRLSGSVPGLCLVTRAPGLANAMAGITVAALDATPLVVLAGQVPSTQRHTQAFQEADLAALATPLCKHAEEVCDIKALPGAIARACHLARAGTPGPVLLSLPQDALEAATEATLAAHDSPAIAHPAPAPAEMAHFVELLRHSRRPFLVAGGGPHLWTEEARALLHELGERAAIPLVTAFRRQGLVDPLHPAAAGTLGFRPDPALIRAIGESDLVILLGTRATAVTRDVLAAAFDPAAPPMPITHVYPDAEACGRTVRAALPVCSTPRAFLEALPLADLSATDERRERMARLHAAYRAFTEDPPPAPGDLDPGRVFVLLREHLPPEAILTSGAGNYALWLHRFFHHRNLFGQLATVSGTMGYGLPAALAARWRFPERPVIAVSGDGCFQMTMADFATAAQYGLGIIVLVLDNGQLGTIRGHQLRRYPGNDCGLSLRNPDFTTFAEACGGFGVHVRETAAFMDAFRAAERAAAQGRPALLHLHVSASAIAPGVEADA